MLENNYLLNFIFFLIPALLIYVSRYKIYEKFNVYDAPDNKLKKHYKKISLFGGSIFFIYLNIFLILTFFDINFFWKFIGESEFKLFSFYFSIISFYLVGLYDDKFFLNYQIKIILFTLILYICLTLDPTLVVDKIEVSFSDKVIYLNDFSKIFSILCFFVFINSLNLYDGIDLQAGSYIFIFFLTLGLITNNELFLYLCIPAVFFLILNRKKEVFLGDNGALLVGFIISYFTIKTYNSEIEIFTDEILILMMLPVIDMSRLFLFRLSKGKNPFKGDRDHIHHILINKFGYNKTIIILNLLFVLPILFIFILNVEIVFIVILTIFFYISLIYKK